VEQVFAPVIESHKRLERALVPLRSSDVVAVHEALGGLHVELHRHLDVADRYLCPLLAELAPDEADDIARYPDEHERYALRIVEQLRVAQESPSTRMLDEIAVDIHRTVIELERRVLPDLLDHLDGEGARPTSRRRAHRAAAAGARPLS
jgi:hypothetical protein